MSWKVQLFTDTAIKCNPNPHSRNQWRSSRFHKSIWVFGQAMEGMIYRKGTFEMSQEVWTGCSKDIVGIISRLTETWRKWIPENWGRVMEGAFGYCCFNSSRSLEGDQQWRTCTMTVWLNCEQVRDVGWLMKLQSIVCKRGHFVFNTFLDFQPM